MRYFIIFMSFFLLFSCADNINKVRVSDNFKIDGAATLAVLNFKNVGVHSSLGEKVAEKFSVEIIQTNKFKLIDRNNTKKVFEEIGFQGNLEMMGSLDEKTKVKLKQLGAQYLMTGSVFSFEERRRHEDNFVLYAKTHITAKLINIESGEVVWTSEMMRDSKAINADERKPKSIMKVEIQAKSAEKLLDDIVGEMVESILKKLKKN
ncbi:MAG: penicillin-binding protein activator LpoB [Calditerrivibrio sp.]|nr:penicillin-binding protein activator LpoB [Calditerrivibrio sp.]MCA1933192.1 penicillin-binding protein activator LpoB [Calditerrivibrio sp.]MCA1980844.1 penicillin-binding protein activator LpoB [Calditerrivibrio sp.]